MSKPTKAEKLADRLQHLGFREVPSTSRKYRNFIKGDRVLWLGRCGALRAGRTISDSISLDTYWLLRAEVA